RRWYSHGLSVRDDVTWVRGGHIIRLGGSLNHTWAGFVRDDGQQNSQKTLQYFIGNTSLGGISFPSSARPPACSASVTTNCLPSSQNSTWNGLYAEVLGMVDGVTILQTSRSKWNSGCSANTDRKSTRLNSSHVAISYAVFCLK